VNCLYGRFLLLVFVDELALIARGIMYKPFVFWGCSLVPDTIVWYWFDAMFDTTVLYVDFEVCNGSSIVLILMWFGAQSILETCANVLNRCDLVSLFPS
jgi:hypothetical protein